MAKKYAEIFKEKYSFLEEYGFIFSSDPFNPERPCYKNLYGQIVVWFIHNSGLYSPLELYVQINGWKKTINLKEEYKKYIGKSTLFKPMEVLFKELFEYKIKNDGEFYGIKVNKISGYSTKDETPLDSFNAYYNPLDQRKKTIKLLVPIIVIGVLFILQTILGIAINDMKTLESMFIAKNIIYGSMIIVCLLVTILLRKKLDFIPKVLFNLYPLVCLLTIYLFEKRTDFFVCFLSLGICLLVSLIYVIFYLIKKDGDFLLDGTLVSIYPFFVLFTKSFILNSYLFFNDDKLGIFMIIGLCVSLITLIVAIIKIKDRNDKKEYVGKLCAAFFIPIILVGILPFVYFQTLNYTFDKSIGTAHSYLVVDKYTRHGGRSGPNYSLVIIKDGKREDISVSRHLYELYNEGSRISFEKHNGFLNSEYYEYVID